MGIIGDKLTEIQQYNQLITPNIGKVAQNVSTNTQKLQFSLNELNSFVKTFLNALDENPSLCKPEILNSALIKLNDFSELVNSDLTKTDEQFQNSKNTVNAINNKVSTAINEIRNGYKGLTQEEHLKANEMGYSDEFILNEKKKVIKQGMTTLNAESAEPMEKAKEETKPLTTNVQLIDNFISKSISDSCSEISSKITNKVLTNMQEGTEDYEYYYPIKNKLSELVENGLKVVSNTNNVNLSITNVSDEIKSILITNEFMQGLTSEFALNNNKNFEQ